MVNPTQAGATTDMLARALVVGLSSRLGQQFVVVNRTGASGAIGTASVARAAPDGYTLLFGAVYVLSVLPAARSNDIGYQAHSLVPVCQTVSNAMVIAVRPDSPFKTLADLVAAARAQPGQAQLWPSGRGLDPQPVDGGISRDRQARYQGHSRPRRSRGGDGPARRQHRRRCARAGDGAGQNLRLLGIFAEERHPSFADTPTVKEQGFDVAPISFGGLLAPAAYAEGRSSASSRPRARARPGTKSMRARPSAAASRRAITPTAPRFGPRSHRDIEAKQRLIARMKLQM